MNEELSSPLLPLPLQLSMRTQEPGEPKEPLPPSLSPPAVDVDGGRLISGSFALDVFA